MIHRTPRWFAILLLLGVHAASAQTAPGSDVRPHGTIAHTWKPVRRGGSEVVAIEVRTEIADLPDSARQGFSLSVPITYAGVTGIAERTQRLVVRDADGDVPLRVDDDPPDPGGFPSFRHWRAQRAVRFPVVVSYDAMAPTTVLRRATSTPTRTVASAAPVRAFLSCPSGNGRYDRVHWDLSDLTAASASTTFGDGDFELTGAPDTVRQGWIMAGPLGRYPATPSAGFNAVWLGTPTFDPAVEMAWAARMYAWLGASYGYLRPLPSYRVFLRVGWRGGTALDNSFMAGASPRPPGATAQGEAPRETFTHEMGHLFVGGIDAPQGVQSWFSEGLNTYYTRLLPMRGGFTSVDDYGKAINADFRQYWHGAARNYSADSIARVGFNDESVRHMPYVRSSIYFADLDARIRAHSHGRRTLDEVIRERFEARARGEPFNHDVWKTTVEQEAGPSAAKQFEQVILQGTGTVVPASNAFGPCFRRTSAANTGQKANDAREQEYEWTRIAGVPDSVCRAWGPSDVPPALRARAPATSRTTHEGTFGGVRVRYTATVAEHLLKGPNGKPNAVLGTIAYERSDVPDRTHRPVTFLFNGGPGSSSSQLHAQGIGPVLIAGDTVLPNPNSILDVTDLVYIDPVGTGFSRPFTTEDGRRSYWTRSGDAQSVADVIRRWLHEHGRENSPKYLAGESYGTVRAAVMLRDATDLHFDGVIMVAVVTTALSDDAADGDTQFALTLPTMAASAWFHGKGDRGARSVDEAFRMASTFADGEYAAALAQGNALSINDRQRVAERMASLIGVPTDYAASHNLRLYKDDWMLHVLAERGLRTGMLDARVTAARDTTRRGGLNDPSFNGGRMRFGTAMLAPARIPGEPRTEGPPTTLEKYLTRTLRFPTLEAYRSLNLDINVVWDHEGGSEIVSTLAQAMRDHPTMRLFWTGGYYDLTTPAHAVERAFSLAGMPAARTTAAIVPGPHAVFGNDESRRIVTAMLRKWIK
ncbi:MAG: hypothetical protein U0132_08385 [Gemmatimonadaceae bacterium]